MEDRKDSLDVEVRRIKNISNRVTVNSKGDFQRLNHPLIKYMNDIIPVIRIIFRKIQFYSRYIACLLYAYIVRYNSIDLCRYRKATNLFLNILASLSQILRFLLSMDKGEREIDGAPFYSTSRVYSKVRVAFQ